jgi:hypothetical protein
VILLCLALILEVVSCSSTSEPAVDRSAERPGELTPPPTGKDAAPSLVDGALADELVIIGGGKDVPALVKEFGGEITFSVKETNTHQAKFPVKDVGELRAIAERLRAKGVQVTRAHVFTPPVPGRDK